MVRVSGAGCSNGSRDDYLSFRPKTTASVCLTKNRWCVSVLSCLFEPSFALWVTGKVATLIKEGELVGK